MAAKIDEATGLPELPENHFWRIGDSCVSIMERIPPGGEIEAAESRIRIASKSNLVWTKHYGKWNFDSYFRPQYVAAPDPITRENILERCTETLLEWQQEIREWAKQKEIKGDYPPKKISEGE